MNEAVQEFARLARRRHDLMQRLNQVEKLMDKLMPRCRRHMKNNGLNLVKSHGMELEVGHRLKVSGTKDTPDITRAMLPDHADLIGVNWPATLAFASRHYREHGELPDALSDVLTVKRKPVVTAKRCAKKKRKK